MLTENLALIIDNLIINDYIILKTNYNRLKDVCTLIFISTFFGKRGKELMRQRGPTNIRVKTRTWAVPTVFTRGSHMVHTSLWHCVKSAKNEYGKKVIWDK